MYRGLVSVRRVCVLVMNLPRGAMTWQMVGGAAAITGEVEASWNTTHAIAMLNHNMGGAKGKAPTMPDYPTGLGEIAEKQSYAASRAEAFARKHMNKP